MVNLFELARVFAEGCAPHGSKVTVGVFGDGVCANFTSERMSDDPLDIGKVFQRAFSEEFLSQLGDGGVELMRACAGKAKAYLEASGRF